MVREEAFAKAFRSSKFAQFDPKIPRIYTASKVPPTTVPGKRTAVADRPAFFGFKRDLHPTHYGRKLEHVQMQNFDGSYGQCTLRNGADKLRISTVVTELQRLLGGECGAVPQSMLSDFSMRPLMFPEGVRIPGRVLNRLDNGGYAIGVGGVVAELPNAEIPPMQHFSGDDVARRRAFYFYVKKAEIDQKGKASIILSLRSGQ